MGVNVPEFNSCCFCMPLRTGLLTLGYINLVYHGLLFIWAVYVAFITTILTAGMGGKMPPFEVTLLFPLVTVSEVTFYVFVIVAVHKKDAARPLKATLILGTALLIFTVPYSVCIVYRLAGDEDASKNPFRYGVNITAILLVLLDPIILGYTILLVRSFKLKIRGEIRGECIDLETNRDQGADSERFLPTRQ